MRAMMILTLTIMLFSSSIVDKGSASSSVAQIEQEAKSTEESFWEMKEISEDVLENFVLEVETRECWKSDEQLRAEGLNRKDIRQVRAFCQIPFENKLGYFAALFNKRSSQKEGIVLNSYTCTWNRSNNTGIPNYSDFGLTSATCLWHDEPRSPIECKQEGRVACLWGCNNTDPLINWHEKEFASRKALEKEIRPMGYFKLSSLFGGDYSRSIARGYRFQIHALSVDKNGKGTWHCEGPEPDPAFNWYAFLRGWWPSEVQEWHKKC